MSENDNALDAFRREWRQEIQQRHAVDRTEPRSQDAAHVSISSAPAGRTALQGKDEPLRSHISETKSRDLLESDNALAIYKEAVKAEAEGRMSDAVLHYRAAFRLDSNIDAVYHRDSVREAKLAAEKPHEVDDDLAFQFSRTLQAGPDYKAPSHTELSGKKDHPSSTARLHESLLRSFCKHPYVPPDVDPQTVKPSSEIGFIKANDTRPSYFARLPDEVLINLLFEIMLPSSEGAFPRINQLEQMAVVCRKMRLITLATPLWKRACRLVYAPPYQVPQPAEQIAAMSDAQEEVRKRAVADLICSARHGSDWRRMWIEQARIRTDGCFISVVQYLRRGEAENVWHAPSHIVIYFRFLRFLSNGTVISLTTTVPPAEIVRSLSLDLRMKGMGVGRWRLKGDHLYCWGLEDPLQQRPKYSLEANYRLKCTTRGKWDKLEMLSLYTANNVNGEQVEVPIQHTKNYFFSPVRAYES